MFVPAPSSYWCGNVRILRVHYRGGGGGGGGDPT